MNKNKAKYFRILAVDDDSSILEFYQESLTFLNRDCKSEYVFDVVLCRQGIEALEAVKKAKNDDKPFAVIFLDLNLPPGKDGIWTGEQIRKLDPFVNFVIVTGLLNMDPLEISLRIPPEDKILYIQKPFHIQEIRQFASALGAKWQSEMLLLNINAELELKIQELERSQQELLNNKSEIEDVNTQLMETNNALSVLARNLDRTKKETERQILQKTKILILPVIEKLKQNKNLKKYQTDLVVLIEYIENLTCNLTADIKTTNPLSTAELRVASLIRNGMTSEEIASHLCVSPYTIKTHRKNIRKKLNLQHSNINLKAYLEPEMDGI